MKDKRYKAIAKEERRALEKLLSFLEKEHNKEYSKEEFEALFGKEAVREAKETSFSYEKKEEEHG